MLGPEARAVYKYLVNHVVPTGEVVTYADVHDNTGVEYGEHGGHIGMVLGEIFNRCDAQGLPPITSIVVRSEEPERRLRMPGPGYFRALAASPNNAGRRQDPGIERWLNRTRTPNFDPDINRWEDPYPDMIADHQASVWRHTAWLKRL